MFIEFELNPIDSLMNQLSEDKQPLWGTMSAPQMVVHLTELLEISNGKHNVKVLTPEDKLPLYIKFLESEKEMPRGFKVDFVQSKEEDSKRLLTEVVAKHNSELELFLSKEADEKYNEDHPLYGNLNHAQWKRLHAKHYTHHFKQFGLIPD